MRNLTRAEQVFDELKRMLENYLKHLERILRELEPILAWDAHVVRVLVLTR